MRIALACGGTGGHVFPGITVGETLRERGHEVTLWVTRRDVENVSLKAWNGKTQAVSSRGFPSGFSLKYPVRLLGTLAGFMEARRLMKRNLPDVLLAMGGYASLAPGLAAFSLDVPLALHEANAVPGKAVSFMARKARTVAVSFEGTGAYLPNVKCVVTGFPVRRDLAGRLEGAGLAPGIPVVMTVGGSQGARFLDETVSEAVCKAAVRGAGIQVIHLARPENVERIRSRYRQSEVSGPVYGFLKEIGRAYNSADFAVARAGAGTCAELKACRLPALLVPLPSARRDHQTLNAIEMRKTGGIDFVSQDKLNSDFLADYLENLCKNPDVLRRRAKALESGGMCNAAEKIADIVEETVGIGSL